MAMPFAVSKQDGIQCLRSRSQFHLIVSARFGINNFESYLSQLMPSTQRLVLEIVQKENNNDHPHPWTTSNAMMTFSAILTRFQINPRECAGVVKYLRPSGPSVPIAVLSATGREWNR